MPTSARRSGGVGTTACAALMLIALALLGGCNYRRIKHELIARQARIDFAAQAARASNAGVETIVLVRHAEKPAQGLGQLTCQGLNRALALPRVIATKFGTPQAIFAMSPVSVDFDDGAAFTYVRPLLTVEPAAVRFGLQVNTSIGFRDPALLETALDRPAYRDALVLVAWEHKQIVTIAKALLDAHGGVAGAVPNWAADDYDGIYVVRILRTAHGAHATFSHMSEGLNGRSPVCPD